MQLIQGENEGSFYKGFWQGLAKSIFCATHTVGIYLKFIAYTCHIVYKNAVLLLAMQQYFFGILV